jgi:hypothetical protein
VFTCFLTAKIGPPARPPKQKRGRNCFQPRSDFPGSSNFLMDQYPSNQSHDLVARTTQWKYKVEPAGTKHLGPMAQDFHAAFGLNGADDKHIATVDEDGVALAAIQGLNQKLDEKDAEIQQLRQSVAELKKLVSVLAQNPSK